MKGKEKKRTKEELTYLLYLFFSYSGFLEGLLRLFAYCLPACLLLLLWCLSFQNDVNLSFNVSVKRIRRPLRNTVGYRVTITFYPTQKKNKKGKLSLHIRTYIIFQVIMCDRT